MVGVGDSNEEEIERMNNKILDLGSGAWRAFVYVNNQKSSNHLF